MNTKSVPFDEQWCKLVPRSVKTSLVFHTRRSFCLPHVRVLYYFIDSAVFTPKDEGNWMMAKLNVQVTDLGYGQIVEHLAKVE